MEYNEEQFKKLANFRTMLMWLFIGCILTAAYVIELFKGGRTLSYVIVFECMCWIPFLIGLLVLKIKGMATDIYKEWLVMVAFMLLCCLLQIRFWRLCILCR